MKRLIGLALLLSFTTTQVFAAKGGIPGKPGNANGGAGGGTTTNSAPVVKAGPDMSVVDQDKSGQEYITLNGSASDSDGTIVKYQIYRNGAFLTEGNDPALFKSNVLAPLGTNTFQLIAIDDKGASGSDSLIVTVSKPVVVVPTNTAPVVNAGADISKTDTDNNGSEVVSVMGSASDAEGNISSYRVLLDGVQVATSLSASFPVSVGSHTVVMEAKDSAGLIGADSLIVNIAAGQVVVVPPTTNNSPPVANAGPDMTIDMPVIAQNVYADATGPKIDGNGGVYRQLITGTASDPNNNIVSYVWKKNGITIYKSTSPAVLASNFDFIQGTNEVTLEVTDSNGVKASDTAVITVRPHWQSLSWSPIHSATYEATTKSVRASTKGILQISAGGGLAYEDTDGDGFVDVKMIGVAKSLYPIASYKWWSVTTQTVEGSSPSILTATIRFPRGTNNIWLTVTDTMGNTQTDVAWINVSGPLVEQVPKIASGVNISDWSGPGWEPSRGWWKDPGAFRFECKPSHLSYDDPIVFPGQAGQGKAHLHLFFGNKMADGNSTYQSLRTTGDGSCTGGPLNRSAYWMPALLNVDNKVVLPDLFIIYYKAPPGNTRLPRGLKMIFGYDSRYPDKAGGTWQCETTGQTASTIAALNCPADSHIMANLGAQDCWNGKDLDSPNHRDHMAPRWNDPNDGAWKCPATHPVELPGFTIKAFFTHTGAAEYSQWRLSSDHQNINDPTSPRLPGGHTLHADWFGAWEDDIMDKWMNGCINGMHSCNSGDLGDYTAMKWIPNFQWQTIPRVVDPPIKPTP